MKRILIMGATSAIAEATAKIWAKEGHQLYLMSRNQSRLDTLAGDLVVRGAHRVDVMTFDANQIEDHQRMIDIAIQQLDGIDIVLIAYGTLSNQVACEQDIHLFLQEFNTNAVSMMSILMHLANRFEAQKKGTIAVITSVAGDRGRQSNYVYGAAKAAVSVFLQGLRQRLYKSGVHVLTIKPGFVDTPMTQAFKKGLLWSSPDVVAQLIVEAIASNRHILYAPKYWFLIMQLVKSIPERYFKRVKL